jgi:hypothetical protein
VTEVLSGTNFERLLEAARPSEPSAHIQLRTRQYIPEDSELQNGILNCASLWRH